MMMVLMMILLQQPTIMSQATNMLWVSINRARA